jgi:hypothetical protein
MGSERRRAAAAFRLRFGSILLQEASMGDQTEQSCLAWIAEKALLMKAKGWKEYPVRSDAALFVFGPPGPIPIPYGDLVLSLRKYSNATAEAAVRKISIDTSAGSVEVLVDLSDESSGFRLFFVPVVPAQ